MRGWRWGVGGSFLRQIFDVLSSMFIMTHIYMAGSSIETHVQNIYMLKTESIITLTWSHQFTTKKLPYVVLLYKDSQEDS